MPQGIPLLRTKRSGHLFPPILRTEELCRCKSPNWLQGCYVITIKKNQNKMDHIIGTLMRSVLLEAFARMVQKHSQTTIHLIQKGSNKKKVEYCVDHKNSLCCFQAIQGHSGGIPIVPELMGYTSIPYNWKEYKHLSQRLFVERSFYLGECIDSGWNRKRQTKASSLLHTSESFLVKIQMKKNLMMVTLFLRRCIIKRIGKHNQDTAYWKI